MEQSVHVDIKDIVGADSQSPNFRDELIVVKLNGALDANSSVRVRIDAFSLILFFEGVLDIDINGNEYHVHAPAFLDVLNLHAIKGIRHSPDYRGYHIIISHDFLEEAMRGIKRLPLSNFLSRYSDPVMELKEEEALILQRIVANILQTIDRWGHTFHRDLVKNELRALFIEISNMIAQRNHTLGSSVLKSKDEIVAHFVSLLNTHCTKEHSVEFYAKELCIESKYLSRILKAVNGNTASAWIDEAIVMQAKMLLKEHDLSVQQIADMLNFSDQSSFGKFFKRHCGLSPMTYRGKEG